MYQLTSVDLLTLGAGLVLLYALWGALYRLYLSPIAGFPGPKLAALTYWYETYYDVVRKGKFVFEIENMHRKYGEPSIIASSSGQKAHVMTGYTGPIVRINPQELVIKDPEYFSELYVTASTRRSDSHPDFLAGMNFGGKNAMHRTK